MTPNRQDLSLDQAIVVAQGDLGTPEARMAAEKTVPASAYRDGLKRVFDVAFVLLTLPVALTLILVFALLIATDGGNPFYCQKRLGRNKRVYRMWKLRTMVPNADAHLEVHLRNSPLLRKEWETRQKLRNDPRITRLGRLLRKSSMDELPQLFNVLTGDMSLVGPRPMMVSQRALYPGQDYYQLRPGITGIWQVSDRNNSTFAARAEFDANYNESVSFKTDLRILIATASVVVLGTGY